MRFGVPVLDDHRGLSRLLIAATAAVLAACGGGGGGGGAAPPVNQAPSANAGADQNVEQNVAVTLAGSGTDDGGQAGLSFSWSQVSGPSVSITNGNQPTATFTAPATSGFVTLVFRLTVSDGTLTDTDDVVVAVFSDTSAPVVAGSVKYEFVPGSRTGLDYDRIEERPVRGATVQVIQSSNNSVLAEGALDDDGVFSLPVPAGTEVFVRVRAELKRSGAPAWDVEVRDNTSSTNLALGQRPLYVLDGQPFNTGAGAQSVNLVARTGWDGSGYTGVRSAAPFSILDTIYTAIELVVSADPDAVFAPLDAFWSVNNAPTGSTGGDIDNGEIGTSFYRGDLDSLFLLGAEDSDTEEFDTHVIAHEWGHYFEDNFARSDSVGGAWSTDLRLDLRLAFGEGWGNAVSGMILDDPLYFDTGGAGQAGGFGIDVDNNQTSAPNRGPYSARSVQAILYDLFDADDDFTDEITVGFGDIYEVLVNEQANGVPFTTIYPFLEALRARRPGDVGDIQTLVVNQRIKFDADAYGTGETNDASAGADVLPVYTEAVVGGAAVNVCSSNRFDPDEDGNKLGVRRFVRFNVPSAGTYTIDVQTTNPPAAGASDPDFAVFQVGFVGAGFSPDANRETRQLSLSAGEHVMEIYEWSYLRGNDAPISQPNDNTCFDITIN